MIAFREFTKEDWYGMAGAAPFQNGAEPLVCYEIKVDGLDTVAVIDAEGFSFEVYTPDGDVVSSLYCGAVGGVDPVAVMRFLATLKDSYQTGELIDMGMVLERGES